MQYMVIWTDGNKYGPATIDTLNQWIREGRLTPDTMLEPVGGGLQVAASSVTGLDFGTSPAAAPAPVAATAQPAAAAVPSYFVVGADGNKYGPADVPTLNQWATQSRLTPVTQLEDASSGQRVPASQVPGINFPMAPMGGGYTPAPTQPQAQQPMVSQQPSPYGQAPNYSQAPGYNPYGAVPDEAAQKDMKTAWILNVAGFLCCPVILPALAIYFGYRAKQAGHSGGIAAMIVGGVLTVLQTISIIINIASMATHK